MKRLLVLMVGVLLPWSVVGCSYHRAYVSYSEYEEDVQVAATGWEGRRLGTVSAGEGGALWERCTDVAEGSLCPPRDNASGQDEHSMRGMGEE